MQPGVTLRDLVHAIPYYAIQQGLLTVEKKGKKNIFNGRILEIEGLPDLPLGPLSRAENRRNSWKKHEKPAVFAISPALRRRFGGVSGALRKCEQAFELSDASAERSAAGCTIKLNEDSVKEYLKSNITCLSGL